MRTYAKVDFKKLVSLALEIITYNKRQNKKLI